MDHRKLNHVLAEINSYPGTKKSVGDSTFVLCPFHSERTPSGRIFHNASSRSPGYFRCYGCGHKAPWDELAPHLGLKPYKYAAPQEMEAKAVVRELASDVEVTFDHKPLPPCKLWRSIRTNLLIDIGCTLISQYGEKFIYMPVNIKEEERGFIRARMKKVKDKPSYLNKAGKWSELYGLFPYDYAVSLMRRETINSLVLVEGPRDALRLLSEGIPAVAILGTQSWSKRKSTLLELSGAEMIITCFDGDDAGIAATELATKGLAGLVKTVNFDLTGKDSPYWKFRNHDEPTKSAKAKGVELWDPGNMPSNKVEQLRELVLAT